MNVLHSELQALPFGVFYQTLKADLQGTDVYRAESSPTLTLTLVMRVPGCLSASACALKDG